MSHTQAASWIPSINTKSTYTHLSGAGLFALALAVQFYVDGQCLCKSDRRDLKGSAPLAPVAWAIRHFDSHFIGHLLTEQ